VTDKNKLYHLFFFNQLERPEKNQNFIFFFYFSQLERLGKNKILSKYEIRNTLLKKAQSLNIKVDKDYEIVHERRMT
jgi:hypothetical protein